MKKLVALLFYTSAVISGIAAGPVFTIDVAHSAGNVSPRLYGLMTEEINHAYDGGLYAELIRNRNFRDDPARPVHWSVVTANGAEASIALDTSNSFNDKLTTSLRLTVTKAAPDQLAAVANSGYWGFPVQPKTQYRASLLARAERGFDGPLALSLTSEDGGVLYASAKVSGLTSEWKRFDVVLKTGKVTPTSKARFAISLERPGTVWFGLVSLFPPTFNNRPNGLRPDLMQMLVDMHPKFLRFPGGNYVEGDTIETRFDWKNTIGPIEERPGHQCPWGYRSTDGMGLLEFLEWCEDMKAEPVLAVYAGYSLKGAHVNAGPGLVPYVQDALDEIEYVHGDALTTWGARRAKDGHPAPFPIHYVEVGNEDFFDRSGSYDGRFAQFYDAIKAKYPLLQLISTVGNEQPANRRVHSRKPDALDEHYYRPADDFIHTSPDYARKYDRNGPAIFVGEWASYEDPKIKPWDPGAKQQPPTPALKAALGDAAFMTALERNSDLVAMHCYAPLFVNVNPGARQWRPDLIGYDAISSYGSPSYYAIEMFSRNVGDQILATQGTETSVQGSATRDSDTGEIFVKLVNPQPTAESLDIRITGAASMSSSGTAITLSGDPTDSNSITEPKKVVPVTTRLHDLKPEFTYPMAPNSIVVLELKARP